MSASDTSALLVRFGEAARKQWEMIPVGDSEGANRAFAEYTAIYSELKRRGPAHQIRLTELLADPSPAVRMAAAGLALEFDPKRAEPVLEEVSKQPRTLGFNARILLEEWRAGRLEFPR